MDGLKVQELEMRVQDLLRQVSEIRQRLDRIQRRDTRVNVNHSWINFDDGSNPHGTSFADVGAIEDAAGSVKASHLGEDINTDVIPEGTSNLYFTGARVQETEVGGDVSGTVGDISVDKVKGNPISADVTAGNILQADGGSWVSVSPDAAGIVTKGEAQTILADKTFTGSVVLEKYIELVEITDPSTPDVDRARMYLRDDGTGKSQLVIKFSSGSVVVIASEP